MTSLLPIASSPTKLHSFSSKLEINRYNNLYGSPSALKKKKNDVQKFCLQSIGRENYGSISFVLPESTDKLASSTNGIGIFEFLQGKSFFITGATGFLGKALIEKILRASPEVRKVYLLTKAESKEAALQRIKTEIIDSDLFNCLRLIYGESYQAFMLSKLVPVPGNVGELNLGMDPDLMNEISQEVDVIIHTAANTTYDERFDVAVNINTKGPHRILNFAKICKKICALIHVSTAFVNKENTGERILSHPSLNIEAEMKLALDSSLALHTNKERVQRMKEMALERARNYGWENVYEFTKAMGEMVIDENREEISVVIIRPSIVESTFKEPYPGWIQGTRMADPIILAYGKGHLPAFINPETVLDLIPVDMVVNATIAATAKHGFVRKPDLTVYHVGSSLANPLLIRVMSDALYQHFKSCPMKDTKGKTVDVTKAKFLNSLEDIFPHISEAIIQQYGVGSQGVRRKFCEKIIAQTIGIIKTYAPYYSSRWFDSSNTYKLWEEMSQEEKMSFGFDVKSLDWNDYLANIHIPGLRKHVMKGK